MVFPVVMYGCESWTVKKAEHQRIDAFELWCWRKLLRVPWTSRRSNQSILKEISPEYSLEELIWSWNSNTLATWCKELTHWKRPWYWERLRAGGEGDNRGWDGWMASQTQWTWVWVDSRSWWWTGRPAVLGSWGHKESDTTEQLYWIPLMCPSQSYLHGNRDRFPGRQFFHEWGWRAGIGFEMIQEHYMYCVLLCLLLLHQLHFTSQGIRSWWLRTCIKAPHILSCNHHCCFP